MNKFEVTFLGTNGSTAYNNGRRGKYGSNTLCVAVLAGDETFILDAGTGISGFAELSDYQNGYVRLLLTHYHIDHISGLLFHKDFFDKRKTYDVYSIGANSAEVQSVLGGFLSDPFAPAGLEQFSAKLAFHVVKTYDVYKTPGGVVINAHMISHPSDTVCYRLEYNGKSLCYCTDVELSYHTNDVKLLEFTRGADLLIMDSFFKDGEVIANWGHSSWKECAEWAVKADVKRLALFHYDFKFNDGDIDEMQANARVLFPNTFASADGMRIEL